MSNSNKNYKDSWRSHFIWLLGLHFFSFIVFFVYFYFSGRNLWGIEVVFIGISSNMLFSLLLLKLCLMLRGISLKGLLFIPYVYFVSSTLINVLRLVLDYYKSDKIFVYLQFFTYVLMLGFVFHSLNKLSKYYNTKSVKPVESIEEGGNSKSNIHIERVKGSVNQRSIKSRNLITISLFAIIMIVIAGAWSSFGMVALDEAKKIRQLEVERKKIIELVDKFEEIRIVDIEKNYDSFKEIIEGVKSIYSPNTVSLEETIRNFEKDSYFSWPDIIMRVSIAALTLFLVQIFFQIYKYNQRKASQLEHIIEVLELYKEEESEHKDLRQALLSKAEVNVQFGKAPTEPTGDLINLLKNMK